MVSFTFLHRRNRKAFRDLPDLYAAYRQQTICNHGGKKHSLFVFRNELRRVLKRTDECVWSSNPRCFIVLHEDSRIIGFCDLRTKSSDLAERAEPYGTVEDFYIAEDQRKKGYGRMLYDRAEKVFRENGTKTVLITPDPVSGTAFWSKMGYADTGDCVPDTDSRIYEKNLD